MATYYVGPGGNDSSDGLTWATRKLTLNGAEDIPLVAGDTVYVAPGIYREELIVDVSGSPGAPITYVADVTGEHTDGVGGIVRITGSDDEQTMTRYHCIYATTARDYRTFRGFSFDTAGTRIIECVGGKGWVVEDCVFQRGLSNRGMIEVSESTQSGWTIRRNRFLFNYGVGVQFTSPTAVTGADHLVENNLFVYTMWDTIVLQRVGGVIVRNNVFFGGTDDLVDFDISAGGGAGQQCQVYNNLLCGARSSALEADVLGDIVEDYNNFYGNVIDRTNVSVGAHSTGYPVLWDPGILLAGYNFPWAFGQLSPWSALRRLAGSGEATDDLHGITRPVTSAKKSWGPFQFQDVAREATTTRSGSAASVKLADAGRHQMFLHVTGDLVTVGVYVYREADYAGILPQMVIKQPGQADRTTTDSGAAGTWNLLSDTFTPDSSTDFVVVELVSNNTATSGSHAVYFDDRSVT